MARRKKKKSGQGKPSETQQTIKAAKQAQEPESATSLAVPAKAQSVPAQETEAPAPAKAQSVTGTKAGARRAEPDRPARKSADQPARRGVSWPTSIAGMFLTFVLGTYIGTLLPGILNERNAPQTKPAEAARQEAAQEAVSKVPAQLQRHIDELEKKTAQEPASVPAWISLGNLYFDAGLPDKAIPAYEKAIALAPGNADVLTDLGIMYREKGDFQKAVECFRKAIAVDPAHQNAMFNEGVVLAHDLHKPQEAASAWERLLGVNPNAKSPSGVPLSELIGNLKSQ